MFLGKVGYAVYRRRGGGVRVSCDVCGVGRGLHTSIKGKNDRKVREVGEGSMAGRNTALFRWVPCSKEQFALATRLLAKPSAVIQQHAIPPKHFWHTQFSLLSEVATLRPEERQIRGATVLNVRASSSNKAIGLCQEGGRIATSIQKWISLSPNIPQIRGSA